MILGVVVILFPSFFGNVIISSLAFIVLIPAVLTFIVSIMAKFYRLSVISLVFLVFSIKIIQEPSELLMYVGWSLILSGIFNLLTSRNNKALIASCVAVVVGIFTSLNARVAMSTGAFIMGAILIIIGFYLYKWKSIISHEESLIYNFTKQSKKINIQPLEYEDATFEELDE